jgi:hypothetical protein
MALHRPIPNPPRGCTRPDLFIAYVMSEDGSAALGRKHKTYISRDVADLEHWVLRRQSTQFDRITDETCLDVSGYRRNFDVLEPS